MKKILAVVLALVLCMALCAVGSAADKYKVGILAPAVTHGWVAGVAYNAEQECLALADEVDYKLYTSNNAEEMTTQLDDLKTWGAQAIVAFPQWEGMEVPIQAAIGANIVIKSPMILGLPKMEYTRVRTEDSECVIQLDGMGTAAIY